MNLKFLFAVLLLLAASACSGSGPGPAAQTLPDNPENRGLMAQKYLEAMPPKEMLQSMAGSVAPRFPEGERKVFLEVMNSPAMEQAANRITRESLVKNFTVGELQAMVTFYGSPEGKAAFKKFGTYMGEVIPQIQQQAKQAMEAAQKQAGAKEAPKTQSPPATPKKSGPQAPPGKK